MMRWYGPIIHIKVSKIIDDRIERAARTVRDYIRTKLSIPNPGGRSPSAPGEYPHRITGHLRRNVSMEYDRSIKTARVGTNVRYGKSLELGTSRVKRRPWMTLAMKQTRSVIKAILSGA